MPFDMLFRFCTFWTCRDSLTMSVRRAKEDIAPQGRDFRFAWNGQSANLQTPHLPKYNLPMRTTYFGYFRNGKPPGGASNEQPFWISNAYPSVQ